MIFGSWTSVSRKSVLPVVEELNGLLFYPVQYEGAGTVEKYFLYRRRTEPTGDSCGGIFDERRGR